ncbi:MAG TPA: Hsp20/alpha crystallin family protein [Salinivirgaceae bacterium]|nr:Hsp20/alpha crystallin family protein [Salinivirgaceae bacterium]
MLPKIITSDPLFNTLLDSYFNDENSVTGYRTSQCGYAAVNIIEHDKDVTIEIVVPGLKKDQINIELSDDILTIGAEVPESETTENYVKREFKCRSFKRSFSLPDNLNTEKISATHENGILRVVIEKKEPATPKGPKQIEIQ